MTKPEPLKNKMCYATKIEMTTKKGDTTMLEGDIPFIIPKRLKSAVEWLKYHAYVSDSFDTEGYDYLIKLIDEAFEDVMKEGH